MSGDLRKFWEKKNEIETYIIQSNQSKNRRVVVELSLRKNQIFQIRHLVSISQCIKQRYISLTHPVEFVQNSVNGL